MSSSVRSALGATITVETDADGVYLHYDPRIMVSGGFLVPGNPGRDDFTYLVRDSAGQQSAGLVYVYVTDDTGDDWPWAFGDNRTTLEDQAVTIDVLANDVDAEGEVWLTWAGPAGPMEGTVQAVFDNPAYPNGAVIYTPAPNFFGAEYFAYDMRDAAYQTDTPYVTVTTLPVNDPPVAVSDQFYTGKDYPITAYPKANDGDVDDQTLIISDVTEPPRGTLWFDENAIYYQPDPDFVTGNDSFSYTLTDGHGATASATPITVTMVEVTGYTLEWLAPDDTWSAIADGEDCVAGMDYRWTAQFAPKDPPIATSVDWVKKAWEQRDNPLVPWDTPPFASAVGEGPAGGEPGVGEWAITPRVRFDNLPSQTPFVAELRYWDYELQVFFEITSIAWNRHTAQPQLAGELAPGASHVQFFPDALTPGGAARPRVDALVTVWPPIAGIKVYTKLYDVDDRNHNGPIDTDTFDQGTNSSDNFMAGGAIAPLPPFPSWGVSDANGQVRLTLDVGSIQPGNNFRVAAHGFGPFDLNNVKALNRDASARLYYDDDPPGGPLPNDLFNPAEGDVALDSMTRHREVAVTDQLVVWRKLHVEVDSMGVPETEVFPDDGIPIDVNPGDVPAPDTELLPSAFEAAYVLPVLGTPYDEDTVDFVYHAMDPAAASRGIGESAAYWAAYVIAAYEFSTDDDGDPNGQNFRFGYNFDDEPEHVFIYMETLRDAHNDGRFPNWGGGVYPQDRHERQAVVHEIGHQFELYVWPTPHPPPGYSIMSPALDRPTVVLPPDSFAEDELLIIRTTASV